MSVSGLGQRAPKTFNITVTGNTGTQTLKFGGNVIGYSIIAPSGAATYNLEFTDVDGYKLSESTGNTGDCKISDVFQMHYDNARDKGVTATLTTATNGAYSIRIWFKS